MIRIFDFDNYIVGGITSPLCYVSSLFLNQYHGGLQS